MASSNHESKVLVGFFRESSNPALKTDTPLRGYGLTATLDDKVLKMKIIENIKSNMVQYLISLILGALSYMLLSVYSDILPLILPIVQDLPKTILLKLLFVAVILFVLSLVFSLVIYLNFRNQLFPRFSLLWDKNKEPHCPACKSALVIYIVNDGELWPKCISCDTFIRPVDDDGKVLTLNDAKKMLK